MFLLSIYTILLCLIFLFIWKKLSFIKLKIVFRTLLLLIFLVFLLSLSFLFILEKNKEKNFNYYRGYVYSNNKPLDSVKISQKHFLNNFTFSDKKGYFQLKSYKKYDDLIFEKNKFKSDTVDIERGGFEMQNRYFLFLRDESDTINLKKNNHPR